MMNNNKILTVSYGTFSCTLEGFEDSFGTMKAIAEYFRDLAADDRYFGAEPPQPDAEMLARIAEREISRRVEAREHEGRIVLSAADGSTTEPASESAGIEDVAPIAAAAAVLAQPAPVTEETDESSADDQITEAAETSDADDMRAADEIAPEDAAAETVDEAEEVEAAAVDKPEVLEAPEFEAEADAVEAEPMDDDAEAKEEVIAATEVDGETEAPAEEDAVTEVAADIEEDATEEVEVEEVEAEVEVEGEVEVKAAEEPEADWNAEEQIEGEAEATADAVSEADAEAFFADSPSSEIETFEEEIEVAEAPGVDDSKPVPESIADKLQRIRAVVSRSRDDDDEADMFEDEHAANEDVSPDLSQFIDISEHAEVAADEAAASGEPSEAPADTEIEKSVVATADDVIDQEDDQPEDDQAEYPEPVSEFGWVSDTDADDTHAEEVIEAATHDIEAAMDADDAIAAAIETDDEDDVAAMLARFDTDLDEVESADIALTEAVDEAATGSDTDDMDLDRLTALFDDENNAPDTAQGEAQNLLDEVSEDDAVSNDQAEVEAPMVLSNEDMVKPGEDQPDSTDDAVRARAFKVKRADIDAAIASGELESVDPESSTQKVETSLSREEEAELLADLAAVEASAAEADATADINAVATDIAEPDFDEDVVVDDMSDEIEETEAAGSKAVDDDDISRLMAEADNQMHEPEGSLRRNAFAHLKAAVMAKKADSDIGKDDPETEGAFRSDLESVVVPRRPEARGEGSKRPDVQRPAPLKLVAEQRVDIESAPKGPVRPRRIAAASEDGLRDETDTGFTDYIQQTGAHGLPDLLEAAASYLSFVEERDQFTRPQLMTKVRQVEGDNFSREDGLRSFGQLLRAGKIKKIKGGRFVATAEIGYRPDHRAAG